MAKDLLCCCGESCEALGIEALDLECVDGVPQCTFDLADDVDLDGIIALCDDDDGDGVQDDEDCAPLSAAQAPGLDEVCDGLDNDCDDAVDEDWPELKLACVDLHPDCGGAVAYTCNAEGTGVFCPAEPPSPGTHCHAGATATSFQGTSQGGGLTIRPIGLGAVGTSKTPSEDAPDPGTCKATEPAPLGRVKRTMG